MAAEARGSGSTLPPVTHPDVGTSDPRSSRDRPRRPSPTSATHPSRRERLARARRLSWRPRPRTGSPRRRVAAPDPRSRRCPRSHLRHCQSGRSGVDAAGRSAVNGCGAGGPDRPGGTSGRPYFCDVAAAPVDRVPQPAIYRERSTFVTPLARETVLVGLNRERLRTHATPHDVRQREHSYPTARTTCPSGSKSRPGRRPR